MASTSFDDVLKLVGTHGRWQWIVFVLTSFSGFFVAFHNMGSAFLASTPEHWCDDPQFHTLREVHNWSEMEIKYAFLPHRHLRGGRIEYSSCDMYVPNISAFTMEEWDNPGVTSNRTHSGGHQHLVLKKCSSWTYNSSQVISTVITEWDLVCGRRALGSTVQSSFMSGVLLGCLLYGWMSDKFGRRKAVLIALVQFMVGSMAAAWSTHYIMFLVLRFISAIGDAGIFSVAFVIITEISGRSSRALLGLIYMVPFSVGFMVLPGIAYYIRDWFWLQLAISIPQLFLLCYFWFLPESPRWLVTQGRFHEAARILEAGANCNGRTLPVDEDLLAMLQLAQKQSKSDAERTRNSGNFLDLVRTPVVRKRSLIIGISWFVAGLVYYGLSFSAPNLGTSVYLYIFLAAAVEVPAFIAVYFAIEKTGRKPIFIGSMLVSGVACLAILAVPGESVWSLTTLALLGKFFSSANYGLVFLYTVELFPTPIRNLSVGTGAMLSRLGSVVSPYVIDLLSSYHEAIPMGTFGILCLTAGFLSLYLPETRHGNLPETVDEIEGKQAPKEVELVNVLEKTEQNVD